MRRSTSAFLVSALLLAGCGGVAPAPADPVAKATSAARVDFVHPVTPDDLIKTVTASFDAGDKEALDRLMLWSDATEEQKRKSAARVFFVDRAGGGRRALEAKILPPDHEEVSKVGDGSSQTFALPLAQVLNVKFGDDSSITTMSFRFGEKDGKYYLAPGY